MKDNLLAQLDNFRDNPSYDSTATIQDFVLAMQKMSGGERALLKELLNSFA